jgi:multidrug efflux pump subunit AcrA (membrane-fusion protein)
MKILLKFGIPILIIVLAIVLMRVLLGLRKESPRRAPAPRALVVNAAVAMPGPLATEIRAYGRVRSAQPVELVSEVNGAIEAGDLPYRPGQRFAKGDLLLRIDERPLLLSMASRKSELLTALATLLPDIRIDFPDEYPVWQAYFDRFDIEGDLEPLPEPANDKIKLFLARYGVYQLYYGVRDQEIELEHYRLVAPFAGVILEAPLREGSIARVGSRLGRLLNLEDIEVEVALPSQDLAWMERGADVPLSSTEIAGEWTGRVARIGGAIDEATQTVSVYLSVLSGPRAALVQGSFVEARIPGREIAAAVRLPQRAVHGDNSLYLIEQGKLAQREVEIARRENGSVLIADGLAAGDSVVTDLLQGVTEGMPVRALGAAMHTDAGGER